MKVNLATFYYVDSCIHHGSLEKLLLLILTYFYFSSSFEFCAILSSFVTYFRGLISHLLRSIKKDLQNRKVQVSIFIYALNTWIGAPLAQIPASVRSGMEVPVALLRHNWAFSSSVLLNRLFLIFLLKMSHMGFRSGMLAGQSSTVISWSANHLEVVLSLWAGAKVLLEKEISTSIKLVSRWKHKVLQNLQVNGCIDFGLDKTQWTNTSKRHGNPKSSLPVETSHWTLSNMDSVPLHSSSRFRTLISKWNAKMYFIWKEDFGPLGNSPVLFLFRCFWHCSFSWRCLSVVTLDALTPASVLSLWSSPKCLNRLCLTVFSSLRSSLWLVHIFLPNFFLPVNFTFNMLWHSTPWTATPFSHDLLWVTLYEEGVNDRLLDNCQVSSLPHYCSFKEQEIPRIYSVWMVI